MRISKKRMGKFSISEELFEQGWDKLLPIFANMIVLKAESDFDTRCIRYLALCTDWEELQEASPAPYYRLEFIRDAEGNVSERRWYRENASEPRSFRSSREVD